MSADNEFEHNLSSAFARAGDDFQTELSPLLAGGLERGRRGWRRRVALNVAGAAAALAVIGTGGFYASGLAHSTGHRATVAAAPTEHPSMTLSAAASSTPPLTGDQVLAALKSVLPQGTVTDASGRIVGQEGLADLHFDNGKGPARVMLGVSRSTQPAPTCPADLKLNWIDACNISKLPDGATVMILQGHEYSDHRADTKDWTAVLTGPDQRRIEINEWNAAEEKGAAVNQADPPLDPNQLTAAVSSRAWDPIVAALPKEQPIPQDHTMPGKQVLATATRLLPDGVTATDPNTHDWDGASFTATNGRATSVIAPAVRDWSKNRDAITKLLQGADRLPDGTLVEVSSTPTGVTVEIVRPDGLEVRIMEMQTAQTGKTPALSTEQLKAIALSPEWKLHG